jgi:hypothetical protein
MVLNIQTIKIIKNKYENDISQLMIKSYFRGTTTLQHGVSPKLEFQVIYPKVRNVRA